MTTRTHATNHTVSAPVALTLVVTIVLLGALAFWAALRPPTLAPVQPTPSAISALGNTAQADAKAQMNAGLMTVTALAQRANTDPTLLHDRAFLEAWRLAWITVYSNSAGEMRAAAGTCMRATLNGRALDMHECAVHLQKAIDYGGGK